MLFGRGGGLLGRLPYERGATEVGGTVGSYRLDAGGRGGFVGELCRGEELAEEGSVSAAVMSDGRRRRG